VSACPTADWFKGTADKSAAIGGGGCYRWEILYTMNSRVEFAGRSI